MNDIITEVNLSTILPTKILNTRVIVDKPTVFITLSDINIKKTELPILFKNMGFSLRNCTGVIIPKGTVSLHNRKLNLATQSSIMKNLFLNSEGKKINVFQELPTRKNNKNNFYFYDMSWISSLIQSMIKNVSEKQLAYSIFGEISNLYRYIKNMISCNVEVVMLITSNGGFFSYLLKNIKTILPKPVVETINIYDNFLFVSNGNGILSPIMAKEKGKNKIILKNVRFVLDMLRDKDPIGNNIIGKDTSKSNFYNIKARMMEDSKDPTSKKSTAGLDRRKLSTVLKKYKISDPDIIANVKAALDTYVSEKGEELTREEMEITILKAINYTIYGKEEIDEEFIKDPTKLIMKLSEIRTHKTPLELPKTRNSYVNPWDIVDIEYTTGVWRQKQEFEDTIHTNVRKLFNSIENVSSYPIKVKNIKHKTIDDGLNRYINYEITLQNMAGGEKSPYTVELKVPTSVNDRYFKIGGNSYIMATQQFLKPVTKTDKNEVRIITAYGVVRIGVKNLKFNPADIDEIISYIKTRYPTLIKTEDDKSYTFSDGSRLGIIGDVLYEDENTRIKIDPDTGSVINSDGEKVEKGVNEWRYEIILNKIEDINPEDKLTKTKKTIPFIYIYIGGIQLPLIIYLWQLKGLMSVLNDLGIDYEMTNSPNPVNITVQSGNKYLELKPKNTREKLLVNGILASRFKPDLVNLDDPESIHPYIEANYGQHSVTNMRLVTQHSIDPISKELLEFENLPTSLPNLITDHCIETLLNKKMDKLSDLKVYRARLSEMMLHIMYKQIAMAHNTYVKSVEMGKDDAKLFFDPDHITKDIQTDAGILDFTEPVSPIDEIFHASKTIKGGKGGVPRKTMYKPEHRNIHPSHYGIMSANTTPESENVGLHVAHTITPAIVNMYGSYGQKDLNSISNWGALSVSEALVPFQNEMDKKCPCNQ